MENVFKIFDFGKIFKGFDHLQKSCKSREGLKPRNSSMNSSLMNRKKFDLTMRYFTHGGGPA